MSIILKVYRKVPISIKVRSRSITDNVYYIIMSISRVLIYTYNTYVCIYIPWYVVPMSLGWITNAVLFYEYLRLFSNRIKYNLSYSSDKNDSRRYIQLLRI